MEFFPCIFHHTRIGRMSLSVVVVILKWMDGICVIPLLHSTVTFQHSFLLWRMLASLLYLSVEYFTCGMSDRAVSYF